MKKLVSDLDFLNYYLGIDKQKVIEYIDQGRSEQLTRIAAFLYRRHHRAREARGMKRK